MSLPNKLMFFATVVIAISSVLSLVLVVVQMIGSSAQTSRLIAAAERVADAMEGNVRQAKKYLDAAE